MPRRLGDGETELWRVVRLVLGLLQMAGAVVALVLLARLGGTRLTLMIVVVTGLLTTISILLFGDRRRSPSKKGPGV